MHETLMPMGGSMPDDNSYGQALSHVFYFLQYTFSFTGIRSDREHSYQTQKKKKKTPSENGIYQDLFILDITGSGSF